MILHITTRERWRRALASGLFRPEVGHSFIHCSTTEQVVRVANGLYRGQRGLVMLVIDPEKARAEVRYEDAGTGERFPHVYGPLNVEAVVMALAFEPGPDGDFVLPEVLRT